MSLDRPVAKTLAASFLKSPNSVFCFQATMVDLDLDSIYSEMGVRRTPVVTLLTSRSTEII